MSETWRAWRWFGVVSAPMALVLCMAFSAQPFFTDAYYHYNAAQQVAQGQGFIDHYLWVYIGLPETLPAPSHLYWMPLTSALSALGMMLFGEGYRSAQIMLAICLWGAGQLAWGAGWHLSAKRGAWAAGIMTLMGGFFLRFWGTTDTFAPYAVIGAGALWAMGKASQTHQVRWWLSAGALAGLGHLTRSDGLLLVLIALWCAIYPWGTERRPWRARLQASLWVMLAYAVVMMPWGLRNLSLLGTPLPLGGTQALWYREYDDLFAYPPSASPEQFWSQGGLGFVLETRWYGIQTMLENLLAVEGVIILTPFMLLALWRRRHEALWRGMLWFAIAIHLAFPLLFPFPSARGGMFHASAALFPLWMALGVAGIEQAVQWLAQRRRHWRSRTATTFFVWASVLGVSLLSLLIALPRRAGEVVPSLYPRLEAILPAGARLMINDPAQLYFFTHRGGVVIPNEAPEAILAIAERYAVDYVLFEFPNVPRNMQIDPLPAFLEPVAGWTQSREASLYAIRRN